MINYYSNLFKYDLWANERVLNSIKNSVKNDRALELFSHILAAQEIWLCRINKEPYRDKNSWTIFSLNEMEELYKKLNNNWQKFLAEADEKKLEEICEYFTLKGDLYKSKISDILTHVVNHSSYHRGQIALLIRKDGFAPEPTDYVLYKRLQN